MALTPKQEAFCQAVADGNTQADAYRIAYDCEGSQPSTIQNEASKLMQNPDISARVREIKSQLESLSLWTREDSIRTLKSVINSPDKAADITAAIKELNSMHGYNAPAKIDHLNSDGSLKPTIIKLIPLE